MYHEEQRGSRKGRLVMEDYMKPFAGKIEGTSVEQAPRETNYKSSQSNYNKDRSPRRHGKDKDFRDESPTKDTKGQPGKDRSPTKTEKIRDKKHRQGEHQSEGQNSKDKGKTPKGNGKKYYGHRSEKRTDIHNKTGEYRRNDDTTSTQDLKSNKAYTGKQGLQGKQGKRNEIRTQNKEEKRFTGGKQHQQRDIDMKGGKPSNKKDKKLLTASLTTEDNPPKKNARFTRSRSLGTTKTKRDANTVDDLKEIDEAISKLREQNGRQKRDEKGKGQQSPDLTQSHDPRKRRQTRLPTREPLRETTTIRDNGHRRAYMDVRETWHPEEENKSPQTKVPVPPSTAANPQSRVSNKVRPTSSKLRVRSYTEADIQMGVQGNSLDKKERRKKSESSINITRNFKGWFVREQIKKLNERILQKHSTTRRRFNTEYKGLMTRVQRRYGVKDPLTPFEINHVVNFLDKKERVGTFKPGLKAFDTGNPHPSIEEKYILHKNQYEKVFISMKQDKKLARDQVMNFLIRCNLDTKEEHINRAFASLFQACDSRGDVVIMVDCGPDLNSTNSNIQDMLIRDLINCLHMGQGNMRVGYVPYSTEVLQCFGLEDHSSRDDLLKALDTTKIESGKGTKTQSRSDLALKKMQEMFRAFPRKNAPKTAILVAAGGSYVSNVTGREAMSARKAGINVIVVGVGHKEDRRELVTIAGGSDSIFYLFDKGHLLKVKTQVFNKAQFVNCLYCNDVAPTDLLNDPSSGLSKEDLMELVWTLYPPPETGIDDQTRQDWLRDKPSTDIKLIGGDDSSASNEQSKGKGKARRELTWVSEPGGSNNPKQGDSWEISMEPDKEPKGKPRSKKK